MDDDTELEDLTIDELEERKSRFESAGWESQAAAVQEEIDAREKGSLSERILEKETTIEEARKAGISESDPAMEAARSEVADLRARMADPDPTERLAQCADVPESAAESLSPEAAEEALKHREAIAEHEAALAENDSMASHTRELREAEIQSRRAALGDLAGGKTEAAALAPSDPADVGGADPAGGESGSGGATQREISILQSQIEKTEARIRDHREAGDQFSARYEEGHLARKQTELAALRPDRDAQAAATRGIDTLTEYADEYRENGNSAGAEKMEEHVAEIRKTADGNEQTESANTSTDDSSTDTLEAPTPSEEEAVLSALNEELGNYEVSDRAGAVKVLKELHDRYEESGWESNKQKTADRLRKLGSQPPDGEE